MESDLTRQCYFFSANSKNTFLKTSNRIKSHLFSNSKKSTLFWCTVTKYTGCTRELDHTADRILWKDKLYLKGNNCIVGSTQEPSSQISLSKQLRGGGGSVRSELLRQLLDDCTHKRNSKRKVGKPMYH